MWYHVYINRTCYQITQDHNWVRLFSIRQRRAGNKVDVKVLDQSGETSARRSQWAS